MKAGLAEEKSCIPYASFSIKEPDQIPVSRPVNAAIDLEKWNEEKEQILSGIIPAMKSGKDSLR